MSIRQCVQAMHGYTPGEQPRQAGLVKLNTNENPYPPSPAVARALAQLDVSDLRLYPDPLCLRLREVIAELHQVTPDHVFVANGSDEALALCTRAFVEDDESIGYFEPSYSLYPVLTAIRNVRGIAVPLGPAFVWPQMPLPAAALFFLCNPNAPTSLLFPRAEVDRFCASFPGVVLIDEAYVDFARQHCMDLARTRPNVLVLRTLSKSYSLAGIRLGYVVGAPDLIGALFKIKDSYNVDRVTQAVAAAALQDGEHMRSNVARIRATRDRLTAALETRGYLVGPSETNFLWVRPPRESAAALYGRLKAAGILIRHFPGPLTGDYVRITVGTEGDADRLLETLGT